jgi:hypothetical protein
MQDVIDKLNLYGYLATDSPSQDELASAIYAYQDFHQEVLAGIQERTSAIITGELDPATTALFNLPRCSCPDTEYELAGSGSWPKGCFGQSGHWFILRANLANKPSWVDFPTHFPRVTASYKDVGLNIGFQQNPNSNTFHSQLSFQRLSGGAIGLAIVPNRPTCNSRIWCKFSPSYRPSDVNNQWPRLFAHELGHNMGLGHTSGGIMNPYILSGAFTSTAWRNDPSERKLRTFFG